MKLINPNIVTNQLFILPRSYNGATATSVVFKNEDTGKFTTITPIIFIHCCGVVIIII